MITVVKVGGSLFDLPDLKTRLAAVLGSITDSLLVVAGGGPAADVVRDYDRIHRLGDESAHWLALRACSLNAALLAQLLDLPVTVDVPAQASRAVVDLHAFALADEQSADHFPHHWDVTSDSMAVRVAARAGAGKLILLKSTPGDWTEQGVVDAFFPIALERTPGLAVTCRNLRK